jgi:hypothetical protein
MNQMKNGLYAKWDGPALFTRRSEVTPSVWAMVYQQEDVVENSIFSPTCVAGCVNGMRKRGPLKSGVPLDIRNILNLHIQLLGSTQRWQEPQER